jgi:hypothetical protein
MAGFLSTLVVSGLLTAAPGGFNFDGPEVSARTTSPTGFFIQGPAPLANQTERGSGSAELTVEDRIAVPRATFGDSGRLSARFRIGGTEYGVELTAVGFPPAQALQGVSSAPPQRVQWPVGGGVILDVDLHGDSGLGFSNAPRMHAGVALWGVGRVTRNGQLLTDSAVIHAAALTAGARSDDDVHGLLPAARAGDHELYVLAWNLPASVEPRGFIEFSFDNVAIAWNGVTLPSVAALPNSVGPGGGAIVSNAPVPGAGSLGLSLVPAQQGVGGSGAAGTAGATGAAAGQPLDPFINQGRVSIAVGQPTADAAARQGSATGTTTPTGAVTSADPFLNEGRVGVSAEQSGAGPSGPPGSGFIQTPSGTQGQPDPFLARDGRVALSANTAPVAGGGLATFGTSLGTSGNFSVLPIGPAVPGASFNFGGTGSDLDVNRTPSIVGTVPGQSAAVPLISTPQPLNAQPPVPLVADPTPLTAQSPVPLVSTPQPLNATPLSASPGVVGTPGAAPAPTTTATPAPAAGGAAPGGAAPGGAAPSP